MRTIKRMALALGLMLMMGGLFAVPAQAQLIDTNSAEQACEAVGDCDPAAGTLHVTYIIGTVVNLLSIALGVVAVIMIIIGGIKYVTSSGDASSIGSAKNTIIYALVGLVVAAVAQVLVRFVLSRVTI